jgi:molybdate transport system substrate-binding protein
MTHSAIFRCVGWAVARRLDTDAMNSTTRMIAARRSLRAAAALLLMAASIAGHAADLTVSAAASLTNAFRDLGPAFEARNPGTSVLLNFGASDALLAQISKGAPADLFASADEETMDAAEAKTLIAPRSRRDFVANTLVLIVPSDSRLTLASLNDLQDAAIKRVALGNPSGVPAGRYARAALQAATLWQAIEPKAVYAQSVRQSLDYVARGEVDAGFVYATDAALLKDKVKLAFAVPTATAIRYPIAVVAGASNPDAARRFIDFVLSPAGQAVLARYGFLAP